MPSFIDVVNGANADASTIQQLVDAAKGTAGKGIPFSLTAVNDAINFALSVKNNDAGASKAAVFYKADGNVLLQVDKNGVVASPDGVAGAGQVVTLAANQTLSGKTLTAPHLTSPVVDSGGVAVTAGDVTQADGSGLKIAGQPPAMRLHAIGAVAANGVAQLLDVVSRVAFVVILDLDDGVAAGYLTEGGANVTAECFDPSNTFTPAAGGAASTNVYWSAGNARYELENKRGGTRTYYAWYVATT